jgi:hypothetical protein
MSLNLIFGTPVYKTKMPNHEEIVEGFMPFIENKENFDISTFWDCECRTTIQNDDKNEKFPWQLFFENVYKEVDNYSDAIGLSEWGKDNMYAQAWINRYDEGQYQEVHSHGGGNLLISCAYMLKLPEESAKFSFYKSNYEEFPVHLAQAFTGTPPYFGRRVTPPLEEGDIIFFPSSLDHYVSTHKSSQLRSTISANFGVAIEKLTIQQS